jgi:hypothetical protein
MFASTLPSCTRVQKKAAVRMYNGLGNHCHGESYCLVSRWSRRFADRQRFKKPLLWVDAIY